MEKFFDDATFVFATLRDGFSSQEKKWLSSFAKQLRKSGRERLCLLTSSELFSDKAPPSSWKKHRNKFYIGERMEASCEITQALHL
tara:strand:- start:1408 stop:1665 length:258 start_codon:yes stop_codon:yes gene_type:complete